MSLVNEVLRQIDEKSHSQERVQADLPLSLQKSDSNHDKIRFLILSLTVLILVVYLSQLYFKETLKNESVQLNEANNNYSKIDEKNSELTIKAKAASLIVSELVSPKSVVTESVLLELASEIPNEAMIHDIEESKIIKPLEEKILLPIKTTKVIEPPANKKVVLTKKLENPVILKKIINRDEGFYQEALGQFISGDVDASQRILKNILDKNMENKYIELQARIYIKSNNSDAFYQLINHYRQNNSISWYKLIAPGLQLFSYYQLSNQYYDELIKIEPNEVRWKLAVALNYSRLGQRDKAVYIYNDLAISGHISDRQRKWLLKKIKRLTLSKA